jgi:hypothetical protein
MAIVSMMRIPGDPDQLLARMDEHLEPLVEKLGEKHGGIANIVARDGDKGLLVINLWESEEGRHAMAAEPELQAALEAAGLPEPHFEGYEVLLLRVSAAAH